MTALKISFKLQPNKWMKTEKEKSAYYYKIVDYALMGVLINIPKFICY